MGETDDISFDSSKKISKLIVLSKPFWALALAGHVAILPLPSVGIITLERHLI